MFSFQHVRKFSSILVIYLFVPAFFLLNSCQSTTEPRHTAIDDYYPLEAGLYRIYEVSEQRFSLTGTTSKQTYQLREVLTTSNLDAANGTIFRIDRYRRASDKEAWQPDSASSVRIFNDQLIKTEGNVSYVKLVFPIAEQVTWDGNAYNSLGNDAYLLRNTGRPLNVLNQTFAETATVIQQNDSTLVNQDKRVEIYARNIGLIYKEKIQLQFCTSTPSCVGKNQIDYGIIYYFRLQSYGKI